MYTDDTDANESDDKVFGSGGGGTAFHNETASENSKTMMSGVLVKPRTGPALGRTRTDGVYNNTGNA